MRLELVLCENQKLGTIFGLLLVVKVQPKMIDNNLGSIYRV